MGVTRTKICGLRRVEDAALALDLGASLLGCVLAAASPRRAGAADLARMLALEGARERLVLVGRVEDVRDVVSAATSLGVERVQIHGAGPAILAALRRLGLKPIPVLRVDPGDERLPTMHPPPSPEEPALLDVGRGGTGRSFDWRILGDRAPSATFIAGGIEPRNVERLLARRPHGIDVSSGLEEVPGVKSERLMREFFRILEANS